MKAFPPRARQGVYRAIASQREARGFRSDAVPDLILARLLQAAQRAPSLRHLPAWKFIVVRDPETRLQVFSIVTKDLKARRSEGETEDPSAQRICEAPINLCVTCDPPGKNPPVRGNLALRSADLFNVCGAIQNLWLAARAEGLGVAWIDIPHGESLRQILGIPHSVTPFAYLCLGYSNASGEVATTEDHAGAPRVDLANLIYANRWGARAEADPLFRHLHDHSPPF